MSFFDEFDHIVPYFVKVNTGKNKPFKTDPSKKNCSNYKGKTFACYKTSRTLEELETHGLGKYMEYLPAEKVSLPINIEVVSDEDITPIFEEFSKYTNKKETQHEIRIFNSAKTQIGYVSLSLTPSGDIANKMSFYESPDKSEEIVHTIFNNFKDNKLIKDDVFEFKKHSKDLTKAVKICQRDGKVVACSVTTNDLETKMDTLSKSIIELSKDEKTPKLKSYVASCVFDETERSNRGGKLIPWECMILETDLFAYQKAMDRFQKYAKLFKDKTGIELSLKKAIEIGELSYYEQEQEGQEFSSIRFFHYSQLAKYLSDESNNLLKYFKGDYIGNILKLTDNGYEACIVTKHQKNNQDYRFYTLIDLTGTSITQGTGLEASEGIDRDLSYFKRLRSADKTPTFVTKMSKDGKEELALYNGIAVSGECLEYNQFVENFITPFSEIKPMEIGKILNKKQVKEK